MGRKEREKKEAEMKSTVFRVKMPNKGEEQLFGVVISTLGGSRMMVFCEDGKERVCRIPGKIKNKVWIKEGDYVIVQLWDTEKDKKGDIYWRYRDMEANFLKSRGYLKFLSPS